MSLILPDWVEHHLDTDDKRKRQTIFSIHVHPDGSRLATGGLDQKVRIWATAPILDEAAEKRATAKKGDGVGGVDKLLCTLSRHTGSVLVVRWSPSGRFLASGSDDMVALVWDLDPSGMAGSTFGSSGAEVNVEAWRPYRRLAGHESDIVDLAWSNDEDDSYIATAALDSKVIVWSGPRSNSSGGFEKLRRIDGHQGFVKGLVWDPIGQYLATASDDKTVKIWRVGGDWGLEKTVTEPFETSPSSTFFRRPSWSPDGAHLLCANAMSGPVFVASVVRRGEWSSNIHLVGHENSVAVTAFSPRLFRHPEAATVLALGSLDQSVSIWITGKSRPVLVARDVFERQVMDLSWSSDGLTLYACSADGHIAVFSFTEETLYPVASSAELDRAREVFGYSHHRAAMRALKSSSEAFLSHSSHSSQSGTLHRPNMLVARKPAVPRAGTVAPHGAPQTKERLNQTITINKDGKRRIRPTQLNGDTEYVDYGGGSISGTNQDLDEEMRQSSQAASSSMSMSRILGDNVDARATKRGRIDSGEDVRSNGRIKDVGRTLGGDLARSATGPQVTLRAGGYLSDVGMAGATAGTVSALPSLPVPDVLSVYRKDEGLNGTMELRNFEDGQPSEIALLEASSSGVSTMGTGSSSSSADRVLWIDFCPVPALLATASATFSAVAFRDGSLVTYTSKGRRTATMFLDSPCCRLESAKNVLVALTADGMVRRWDTKTERELHRPLSIHPILDKQHPDDEILIFRAHVTNGLPIVVTRYERAYLLDDKKLAWMQVSSGWLADCSPMWEGRIRVRDSIGGLSSSNLSSMASSASSPLKIEPVRAIESEINDLVVLHRSALGIQPAIKPASRDTLASFEAAVGLRHLEMRMQAATLLESPAEFKTALMAYARRLGDEGIRNQAEDLVKSLLGPIYFKPGEQEEWDPKVCGHVKRELLAEVLRNMSRGRLLQGLVTSYQDTLRQVQAS